MQIIKIKQRDNKWITINSPLEYEIKTIELKKGKPTLHLIYNNDITFKVIYKCNDCAREIETRWSRFVKTQINNNKCLCQKCTMKLDVVKDKISISTRIAMDNDDLRKHLSLKQNERWSNVEEREKRKLISQEIISRDGMREYISRRTTEEMNKLNTSELCNPTKYMTDDEKKEYYRRIAVTKRANYNETTKKRYLESLQKTMKNKKNQNNVINGLRTTQLKKQSNNQKIVVSYIKKNNININDDIIEEYPINLYDCDYKYKFLLIDIVLIKNKIAIEISGNYYHDAFNDYLNGLSIEEVNLKYKDNKFHLDRFAKDLFKQEYLTKSGWKLYYITENEIINCDFIDKINNILEGASKNEITKN